MKLSEVQNGYGETAPYYDKLLHFWFGTVLHIERYRKKAIDTLNLKKRDIVLDIGCGTGVNFSYIKEKIGSTGRIIGIDYSDKMLAEARKKIKERGWKNIIVKQGDAVNIHKLVKEEVDAIISTYCFSIIYNAKQAFQNALHVLKPNGTIVILDFATVKPRNMFVRSLYRLYSWYVKKRNISSDDDLNKFEQRKKQWMDIAEKKLTDIKKQEFLFGMGLLYGGRKR